MNRVTPLGLTALSLLLLTTASAARAGELPRVKPAEAGLSADRLAGLGPELQKLADAQKVAGGVVLVARHGKVAYFETFGLRDLESRAPMTEDTIFAIASMTKPITCVAVMTLVEQGKLGLDDPVAKYLPGLKDLRVLGDPKDDTAESTATVPAKRGVTVRDLLSHSSGLAYGGALAFDPRLGKLYEKERVMGRDMKTVADQVTRLARVPLAHQPGEGWTYGLSHDVLGRVVEVVSGQPFDAYLSGHVFRPLGMKDTSFFVPESKRDRVATIYRGALLGGSLTPLPKNYGSETFFSGGGGLFSTARDYARFAQMLLNGGELDGVRVLKRETLAQMTANQIGGRSALGGMKYGLGFGLEMTGTPPELHRFLWGGIFSTNFWVDPKHDLIAVVMTQLLPTNASGAERVVRRAVEEAVGE